MKDLILTVLYDFDNVSQVEDYSFLKTHYQKSYEFIYKFISNQNGHDIPFTLSIPYDWDRNLIDVYIDNYKELKYIPHVESKGKLCLFDIEGVLIEKNFAGLLTQTLKRAFRLISMGLNEDNKIDFIHEFDRYWGRLPKNKTLKSMVSLEKRVKLIKYGKSQKEYKKGKGDKEVDIRKAKENYSFICSDLEKDISFYKDVNEIKNGLYLYIKSDAFIYPPDWRNKLDVDFINTLLRHESIDRGEVIKVISRCENDLIIVFHIEQPSNEISLSGVFLDKSVIDLSDIIIRESSNHPLIPLDTIRCDEEFLLNRGGASLSISDKRVLIIGCGSIGGYLVNEIIKSGIKNITLVDKDILSEENIYRHLLGMDYIKKSKSMALAEYFNKNIPRLNLITVIDSIEDSILDGSIDFCDYDLIVSTVGNHNLNRWINEFLHSEKIDIPVLYLWNEALGIGSHAAYICTDNKGCYECFIGSDDDSIYDKTSYYDKGQVFVKRLRGCSSGFIPFSSSNSLSIVVQAMEIIKMLFEGEISDNMLISIRSDSFSSGLNEYIKSNRYNLQTGNKQVIMGSDYVNPICKVCGDN